MRQTHTDSARYDFAMRSIHIGFAIRGACIIAAIAVVYLALCEDRLTQSEIEQAPYELSDDEMEDRD